MDQVSKTSICHRNLAWAEILCLTKYHQLSGARSSAGSGVYFMDTTGQRSNHWISNDWNSATSPLELVPTLLISMVLLRDLNIKPSGLNMLNCHMIASVFSNATWDSVWPGLSLSSATLQLNMQREEKCDETAMRRGILVWEQYWQHFHSKTHWLAQNI